ncbi:MAG TPA: VOC family protein [Rhodopseudomonas sp.]|uniref:VOC family protein n=1 Tax=Rhodopseudomonas sp. TaxID=1078 RepID=UPI002ED9D1B0
MLGRLNHVAIAVQDAEQAARIYGAAFGAEMSAAVPQPEIGAHGKPVPFLHPKDFSGALVEIEQA